MTSELYYKLAQRFMPGPITVILPKKDIIPLSVTGGLPTVAVRVPLNIHAHKLISAAGVPVAAPSANISGRPSATFTLSPVWVAIWACSTAETPHSGSNQLS